MSFFIPAVPAFSFLVWMKGLLVVSGGLKQEGGKGSSSSYIGSWVWFEFCKEGMELSPTSHDKGRGKVSTKGFMLMVGNDVVGNEICIGNHSIK
ncbi:hypothetical protein L873DRAFT_1804755 [Choiromyces venosus 120613-1]|uniref:Uncharacterized protein n=1 Tax=Choiromyces venosus 120613-1 TaxID=1336337 RepID=A0A3N4JQR8_9PEZI|nr:hypothetical protein L873DRAFT_1804755 [Choiromyces venosus 120613-1]